LESELKKAGFTTEKIEPMGGFFAVIYDLFYSSLRMASKNIAALKNRIFNKLVMPLLAGLFLKLDIIYSYKSQWITTGYYTFSTKSFKGGLWQQEKKLKTEVIS